VRLSLPLARPSAIVRRFGEDPDGYAIHGFKGHNGLDLAAEDGEHVLAVDDGHVVEVRLDAAGYGLTVRLEHAWGESRYAHGQPLSAPPELVIGHRVHRGDRVLLADGRGHIHFGLRLRRPDGSLDYSNAGGFGGYDDPLPLLAEALGLAGISLPSPAARPPRAARSRVAA